ncbi:hypothetical protein V8C26DRAFT_150481 [Trichoderma gracile]
MLRIFFFFPFFPPLLCPSFSSPAPLDKGRHRLCLKKHRAFAGSRSLTTNGDYGMYVCMYVRYTMTLVRGVVDGNRLCRKGSCAAVKRPGIPGPPLRSKSHGAGAPSLQNPGQNLYHGGNRGKGRDRPLLALPAVNDADRLI